MLRFLDERILLELGVKECRSEITLFVGRHYPIIAASTLTFRGVTQRISCAWHQNFASVLIVKCVEVPLRKSLQPLVTMTRLLFLCIGNPELADVLLVAFRLKDSALLESIHTLIGRLKCS